MSKKSKVRNAESVVAKPRQIRADKLICGDRVPMSKSILTVEDIEVRGETIVASLRMESGGCIDVTYHCNEPVQIEE